MPVKLSPAKYEYLATVPCMFRSTANDGNSSSYIGLLIRPSSSGTAQQGAGQTVSAAVVGSTNMISGSNAKIPSLHVVPSSLKAQPITSATSTTTLNPTPNQTAATHKVVVPAGVQLRLQPAAVCATTPQCNDGWIHAAPRPVVNTTFDSPSPSQVVPQMNVGDSYECSVPCASSSSFFPPISSITQNLSSAKSDIDLLQEISSVEMNVMRNQKVSNTTASDYVQSTTPQQYHTNAMQNIYSAPTQMTEMPTIGRMPSCRYQSGYNGANDCSATPDSGIQSIAGSPPSSGPFTPPLPSPAPCITLAAVDVTEDTTNRASTSADDFSDMPRLIPFHQVDEDACSTSTAIISDEHASSEINKQLSHEIEATAAACEQHLQKQSTAVDSNVVVPKIAITPAMNVNDLVEQIMSQMDAEQRKQFANVIKSKVCESGHANATDAHKDCSKNDLNLRSNETALNELQKQINISDISLMCESNVINSEHSDSSNNQTDKDHLQFPAESSDHISEQSSLIPRQQSDNNNNNKVKSKKQRSSPKNVNDRTRKRKRTTHHSRNDIIKDEPRLLNDGDKQEGLVVSSERSFLDAFVNEKRNNGGLQQQLRGDDGVREQICDGKGERKLEENMNKKMVNEEERSEEVEVSKKEKLRRKEGEDVKKEEEDAEKLKRNTRKGKVEREEELKRGERSHENEEVERTRVNEQMRNRLKEEDPNERLRTYRCGVKRKLNEQLKSVIEKVEKQLSNIELSLGPHMHWTLPWYRLNWKDVAQRLVERDRLEKLAKEKSAESKKVVSRKKMRKVTVSKMDPSCSGQQSLDEKGHHHPGARSYIKIKHNVIVDAYPRIEQLQCSCQRGGCGELDECLNRMVQMECTSNCNRGVNCSNKRIYRRECVDKLSVFETANGRGLGVKTGVPIPKGQFVCEYVGEVVSMETFDARNEQTYRKCKNHYALNLCPGFVIDAYQKGNLARFVNHSCTPNCEMQRWSVNGQHRIGLFALRSIAKDEELTYDYNWDSFDFQGVTPCSCGVPDCRGFLNKNVLMNAKEKELARNYGVLLLRNVRKSAKRKMDAARAEFKASKDVSYRKTLRSFTSDMLLAFSDREAVSKKQLKQMKNSIESIVNQPPTSTTSSVLSFQSALQAVEMRFIESFDAYKKRESDKKKVQAFKCKLGDIRERYREQLRKFGTLPEHFDEHSKHNKHSKSTSHRILTANTDLSYLDCEVAVGSYDPDSLTHLGVAETDSDCVRCICGITDDDGSMVQCDTCHFWLHEECVVVKPAADFKCDICRMKATRTPAVDIVLRSQPQIRFKRCTYYRSLVNVHNIQVRVNETVYLQKLANDDHKMELKRLNETCKGGDEAAVAAASQPRTLKLSALRFQPKAFDRKDVRCFRVERLFASPDGHNFVFGFYYARPHEVYCEPGRMFHEKEMFATPMFDTLPLDAVVGRCLVVEPRIYVLGRPRMPRYNDADVYFCEYQTGKNSRYFEKIPSRNHYYINIEPHNFIRFAVQPSLVRTFTPFIMERHNNMESINDTSSSSASSHHKSILSGNSSKKIMEQKRTRLESIVAGLPSSNEHYYSPPRKIARHSGR
ncbi:unnamed protein product [Anisakis simplex]|uniref:Histone-lysine N-methyltransferase n=1 Tax=Anisakis simplex TaxID=6269 RepID=A0A0M3JUL3_ANISI|nr:unnamed protein product [Anisakis simplex]